MKRPRAGVCRFCGCTERNACGIYLPMDFDTVTCSWLDATRTVCTNVRCIDAHHREERQAKRRPRT